MTRSRSRLVFVVAAALWLAACGPTAPPPAATTAPAANPTTAAAAPTTAPALPSPPPRQSPPHRKPRRPPKRRCPPTPPPPDQQVLVLAYDNTQDFTTLDFFESVYKRGSAGTAADLMSEPLVRINKNFEIVPAAATVVERRTRPAPVWTFKLDPNLMWSDDTPVTADDYVATFRYGADPKHAWDFTWFFGGVIKNWDDVVAGKVPVDQLGVKAVDAHTLQVTTQQPAPYLPAMMLYSQSLQKKALEAHGGLYNSDPATSVSDGPFILKEWRKGDRVDPRGQPQVQGHQQALHPEDRRHRHGHQRHASPPTRPARSTTSRVRTCRPPTTRSIAADPALSKEVHPHYGDFRTDYLFFDYQNPPFNNLKVRQAFSHVIPRDDLIKQIIKPSQGIPAYSFLMPGFPAANSQGLKDIQSYDPATAKQLLADAGYPDGKGFPKLTLWLRN